MAEANRMTTADVVAKVMAGEHGDFVREAVALVARELMEAEISVEVGAERGEVSPRSEPPTETATAHGPGRRGSVRSSCLSPRSVRVRPTSRASLNRAGEVSRQSSPSSLRHTSTE